MEFSLSRWIKYNIKTINNLLCKYYDYFKLLNIIIINNDGNDNDSNNNVNKSNNNINNYNYNKNNKV